MPPLHLLNVFILPIKNSPNYAKTDRFTKNPLRIFFSHTTSSLHPSRYLNPIEAGALSKLTISLHLRRPIFHTTFVLQRTRK
ncbi:hypothetical protein IQ31_04157 [Sphingobacterium siyangense]|uniref:Uncharacterized protein n=3 Tax=Sphingobacterium TaxID=28453 RepID=A0A562MA36_9SPHI|nr:hypothetical protein IQ31_04157 [Sphingobacterium siyangense]